MILSAVLDLYDREFDGGSDEDGELEKVPGTHGVYRYKASGVTTPDEAIREADESESSTAGEGSS